MGSLFGPTALLAAFLMNATPCSDCVSSPGLTAHVHGHFAPGGRITPPGPGYGWGYPNGAPDGYGWVDYGTTLPLGGDRTSDYFFRRQWALPPSELFLVNYYNPYLSRGQRYLPFTGAGGAHPAGGEPTGSAILPMYPYEQTIRESPSQAAPIELNGRVEERVR